MLDLDFSLTPKGRKATLTLKIGGLKLRLAEVRPLVAQEPPTPRLPVAPSCRALPRAKAIPASPRKLVDAILIEKHPLADPVPGVGEP